MASNEHPDMSGNPCDMPLVCEICGADVREDRLYGSSYDDFVVLCSTSCASDFDERFKLQEIKLRVGDHDSAAGSSRNS